MIAVAIFGTNNSGFGDLPSGPGRVPILFGGGSVNVIGFVGLGGNTTVANPLFLQLTSGSYDSAQEDAFQTGAAQTANPHYIVGWSDTTPTLHFQVDNGSVITKSIAANTILAAGANGPNIATVGQGGVGSTNNQFAGIIGEIIVFDQDIGGTARGAWFTYEQGLWGTFGP